MFALDLFSIFIVSIQSECVLFLQQISKNHINLLTTTILLYYFLNIIITLCSTDAKRSNCRHSICKQHCSHTYILFIVYIYLCSPQIHIDVIIIIRECTYTSMYEHDHTNCAMYIRQKNTPQCR